MKKSNYYIIGRKNGLKLLKSDVGKWEKKQIEINCFEICCTYNDVPAIAICPFPDGQIAVSASRVIDGSCTEQRKHEETQGFLVEKELFIGMMPYLCGKRQDHPLFLQKPLEDNLEILTDEQLSLPDYDYSVMEEESFDDDQTKKLMKSLKYILDNEEKYWISDLDYEEGLELQIKLHYIGIKMLNKSFYSISNGELSKLLPKLIITKNLKFPKNEQAYKKLTYDEFILLGNKAKENSLRRNKSRKKEKSTFHIGNFEKESFKKGDHEFGIKTSKEQLYDEMLEEVRKYSLGFSTQKELLKKRKQLKPFSEQWICFRNELRERLWESKEADLEKLFDLILLAFEKTSEELFDETALPVSLYNEKEMFDFLAKLTDNKKELYYFYNLYIEKTVNRSVGIYGKKRFLKRLMSRNILLKCGGIIWNKNPKKEN